MYRQHAPSRLRPCALLITILACCASLWVPDDLAGQARQEELDRVMTLVWDKGGARDLPEDRGSAGLWQRLLKLQTTASVLHIVAHPDDEHGGVLAYLSRGQGVRTALLSLNRGEGGANAVGSELFDALGLVRTEELLLAGAYYGLDDLYFSTMIDYGFSKTLEESLRQWGRENVLRDVVRVIRINRPLVVLARFHGSERDGHGNHQAAGLIAQEAFLAAGDPNRFPEQIREEGLRPWQPLKLYRGGVREEEPWQVRLDAGAYSPWLGLSYRNVAARGLGLQRSQTSGQYREGVGAAPYYYERMHAASEHPAKEAGFFDGIDTTLSGLFDLLGETPPPGARELLTRAREHIDEAVAAFDVQHPADVVPALVQGLKQVRAALPLVAQQPDVSFHLRIKERQLMDAVNAALGIRLTAVAVPAGTPAAESPWAPLPTMGVAVPGQSFQVEATLLNPSPLPVRPQWMRLEAGPGWRARPAGRDEPPLIHPRKTSERKEALQSNAHLEAIFDVTVPEDAAYTRRYFYRDGIQESRYAVRDSASLHLPFQRPPLIAAAQYLVEGEPVEIRETVRRREANFPYGHEMRILKIAPAIAVNVRPEMRIVPLGSDREALDLQVELLNNLDGPVSGELRLEAPSGWQVQPPRQPFAFSQPGERRTFTLQVVVPRLEGQDYTLQAVATANGKEYREGYQVISHRDNDTHYLYRPAVTKVRGVDVKMASGLQVGYVMGVGDEVPAGIEQLGADVYLLAREDLATGDLTRFDAIVVGTRAYAVRQDLLTYNQRLLDFARQGGNLIVLYQTQEFVPEKMAPYPAALPRSAEEVSEEDAPVRILAGDHPAFNRPNEIAAADFDGWVEQRGSKFLSEWDTAYVPMIETQDRGQAPQRGGWVTARCGDGYYTYFAYAVHRQLPYAVPGAYRLFANLLSLGKD